jgi:chromosome partitioning protein
MDKLLDELIARLSRQLRRRIAFANQKGGVGKTLLVLLLATAAARRGLKVLVVDFDPQGNATRKLLGKKVDDGTVALMEGAKPVIHRSPWAGVDVIGSSLNLAKAELDGSIDAPYRANAGLEEITEGYDLVFFDTPPNLGRMLAAALIAADGLVLVTDASDDGLDGVKNVIESFETVRSNHMNRREIELLGIIINRYKRAGEQDYREAELREVYGPLVFPGHITDRSGIPEAHSNGITVWEHAHDNRNDGARAGGGFADHYLELLGQRAGIALPPVPSPTNQTDTTAEEATR